MTTRPTTGALNAAPVAAASFGLLLWRNVAGTAFVALGAIAVALLH